MFLGEHLWQAMQVIVGSRGVGTLIVLPIVDVEVASCLVTFGGAQGPWCSHGRRGDEGGRL